MYSRQKCEGKADTTQKVDFVRRKSMIFGKNDGV